MLISTRAYTERFPCAGCRWDLVRLSANALLLGPLMREMGGLRGHRKRIRLDAASIYLILTVGQAWRQALGIRNRKAGPWSARQRGTPTLVKDEESEGTALAFRPHP